MAKADNKTFLCTECGNETSLWSGKCPSCGAWNTLKELDRIILKSSKSSLSSRSKNIQITPVSEFSKDKKAFERISSGVDGFDYVLGGGFVEGEVVLVAGEPGVGKSTL